MGIWTDLRPNTVSLFVPPPVTVSHARTSSALATGQSAEQKDANYLRLWVVPLRIACNAARTFSRCVGPEFRGSTPPCPRPAHLEGRKQ